MWKPDESKLFPFEIALIDSDYKDLLYHDLPILFSGRNTLQDRVIGSFVEINQEYQIEAYLHSIVDETKYISFINQRLSYPELLQQAQVINLVHWNGKEKPAIYATPYNEIPVDYRPDARAYCPPMIALPALDYEVKFTGGLAENHQATPATLGKFHAKFSKLLKQPFDLRGMRQFVANVLVQAPSDRVYAAGSLKVNYHIELAEKEQKLLFDDKTDYLIFIDSYLTYCLHDLPNDMSQLRSDRQVELLRFNDLWTKYQTLDSFARQNPNAAKEEFINNLLKIANRIEEVSETVGDEFKETVLSSISASEIHQIGVLSNDLGAKFEEAIQEVEKQSGKQITVDDEPGQYTIHIYDLNTDTRKGRALTEHPSDKKKISKPSITVLGDGHLSETRYTESLHLDKYIDVLAKATKIDNEVRHLDILFESDETT